MITLERFNLLCRNFDKKMLAEYKASVRPEDAKTLLPIMQDILDTAAGELAQDLKFHGMMEL